MKRLRENAVMEAEIGGDGKVLVEGHHVGELQGFRFTPDVKADGPDAKAVRAAAQKALASEFETRAERFGNSPNGDLALGSDALLRWLGSPVASLTQGDDALHPRIVLLADEQLTGPMRDKVAARAERYVTYQVSTILKPLVELKTAEGLEGAARGIAYRLCENFGLIQRRDVAEEVRALDQDARAALRRYGVRFGAYHIFIPALVKPAPANLLTLLWAIAHDGRDKPGFGDVTHLLSTGRTSAVPNPEFDPVFYGLAGYRLLGRRAVRIDILERLADLIRPALSWKPGSGKRPEGGYNGAQFLVTPAMMSILGATADDMDEILRGLGYRPQGVDARQVEDALAKYDLEAITPSPAMQPAEPLAASADETPTVDDDAASGDPADAVEVDRTPAAVSAEAGDVTREEGDDIVTSIAVANEDESEAPVEFAEGDSVILPLDENAATTLRDDGTPTDVIASDASALDGDPLPLDVVFADDAPALSRSDEDVAEGVAEDADTVEIRHIPAGASLDAPANADAALEPAKAETAKAEEAKLVQVWRPQRQEARGGRDGNRNNRNRPARDAQPRDNQNRGAQPGASAAADAAAPSGDRGPRHGRNDGQNRAQRFAKAGEAAGNARPPRFGGKGSGEGRDGRNDRPERGRPDGKTAAPRFDKPPAAPAKLDPDSPFAKLAALRDKLGK